MADEYYFEEGCYITELHNRIDDAAVSVARARVPVGVTTRWHVLAGIVERYLIESGEGEAWVGDAPPRRVRAGDTVGIAAGQRQRIRNIGTVDLIFLAVCTPRFVPQAYTDESLSHGNQL